MFVYKSWSPIGGNSREIVYVTQSRFEYYSIIARSVRGWHERLSQFELILAADLNCKLG